MSKSDGSQPKRPDPDLTLPCAGCGGKATFTTRGDRPTFFHTMPVCERFNATNTADELTEYMQACAAKLGEN